MFIIGIDPHKGSHTAAVIDRDEQLVGELSVVADRRQRDRLLRWAAPFEPRLWAVEGATGHGALLANNSSRRARRSLTCPPHCRQEHDCWMPAATTRPTGTTRARRRSSRYDTETSAASSSRITAKCCGCSHVVITS